MKQDGDLAWFFTGYLIREQERMKKGQEKKTKDDILWKAAQERAVVFNDKRSGRDGNWKEPVPTARSVRASPSPKTCRMELAEPRRRDTLRYVSRANRCLCTMVLSTTCQLDIL